jgi:coproporphyrinogen III oxidase
MITPIEYCPDCERMTPLYTEDTPTDTSWHCQVCDKLVDFTVTDYDNYVAYCDREYYLDD